MLPIYHNCMLHTVLPVQGFICPICMEALRSAEALQVHWEAAHSSDNGVVGGGGGGASAISSKSKTAVYVVSCIIVHL